MKHILCLLTLHDDRIITHDEVSRSRIYYCDRPECGRIAYVPDHKPVVSNALRLWLIAACAVGMAVAVYLGVRW